MENLHKETPFGDNLVESGISEFHKGKGKLFELEHNPDKIIRVESFERLEKRYHGQVDPVTVAGMGKKLFEELGNSYGILAPVDFIAGKDSQGKDVVFGITDKIDGTNLDKIEVTPEIVEQVERLYTSIAQYYLDKLHGEQELYLADINNASQYVYGTRKGDETAKIYLVDTDLYIRDGKIGLYNVVLWLVRHMGSVEQKYHKRFYQARNIIEQFLNESLPQNLTDEAKVVVEETIAEAKGFLVGQFPEDDEGIPPVV